MRHRVSEGLEFLVTGLQGAGSSFQLVVQLANFFLPTLAIADVVVRFQDRHRLPLLVLAQRPSAGYEYTGAVGFCLLQLAFPAAGAQQLLANLVHR